MWGTFPGTWAFLREGSATPRLRLGVVFGKQEAWKSLWALEGEIKDDAKCEPKNSKRRIYLDDRH